MLRELIIDCDEPRRVAGSGADVLGWEIQRTRGPRSGCRDRSPVPDFLLVFVPVPEKKAGKNRLHLDVSPVGCERDEEVARLEALGATHVDVGQVSNVGSCSPTPRATSSAYWAGEPTSADITPSHRTQTAQQGSVR